LFIDGTGREEEFIRNYSIAGGPGRPRTGSASPYAYLERLSGVDAVAHSRNTGGGRAIGTQFRYSV
jgi:hypothetical protein